MVGTIQWLALEVKYLDRSRAFYEAFLDLSVCRERDGMVAFETGDAELRLVSPGTTPRGGVHTHYALSIPAAEYDDWYDQLDERFDLVEHSFGDARSLYFYDPDGNCIELGESEVDGPGVDGLFEVVLEVTDVDAAESFYQAVGFETVDRGDDRRRVRMTGENFAIELWEPGLGVADARGGLHVDLGVQTDEPEAVADRVRGDAHRLDRLDDGVRVVDRDGHALSLVR